METPNIDFEEGEEELVNGEGGGGEWRVGSGGWGRWEGGMVERVVSGRKVVEEILLKTFC